MRKRRNPNMINLYMSYIFQKSTILIFSISIVLMIGVLLLILNPNYDKEAYLISYKGFHLAYLEQSIFIIGIFNGILVTTITIILVLQSISFDCLFIASMKRTQLSISKLISVSLIFLLLALIEYVVLFGYPYFFYSNYRMEWNHLLTIPILYFSMLFLYSLEALATTLLPTIFTPMIVLFCHLVVQVLAKSFSALRNSISYFLPIIEVNNEYYVTNSLYMLPIWVILFSLLTVSLYNIKDLKQA